MAKLYAKAPDGSDALLSIVITGFTQSLQQNGWCKLPNGLLFQWSFTEPITYRFPVTFNSAYSVAIAAYDRDFAAAILYNDSVYLSHSSYLNVYCIALGI